MKILAPISVGELIDKITILEIKAENIKDFDKLENINRELEALNEIEARIDSEEIRQFKHELKYLNGTIWRRMNQLWDMERRQDFHSTFTSVSRSVLYMNDSRAAVKDEINRAFLSEIVEEKSYGRVPETSISDSQRD